MSGKGYVGTIVEVCGCSEAEAREIEERMRLVTPTLDNLRLAQFSTLAWEMREVLRLEGRVADKRAMKPKVTYVELTPGMFLVRVNGELCGTVWSRVVHGHKLWQARGFRRLCTSRNEAVDLLLGWGVGR